MNVNSYHYCYNLDFVTALLHRAQQNDKQIMEIFQSSFDGDKYNELTFDNHFFIENIEALLKMPSSASKQK